MSEPAATPAPLSCREEMERLVRSIRLRLEDERAAGLAMVPCPLVSWGGAGPCAVGHPSNKDRNGRLRRRAQVPREAPAPAGPPEARVAQALRGELSMTAASRSVFDPYGPGLNKGGCLTAPEGQDGFDFGSPDLGEGLSRKEALARVAAEVAGCTRCPELVAGRTQTVPGQGSPEARLVFVGEGPGEEEDRQGLAFVGRAGQLLTKMIESIGLTRDQVFICNILKCRPPGNRNPTPEESANCLPYLMRQLEILRPRVACALGGVAAKTLLQTHDGITRLRGRFHPYKGLKLMPTFHPAYVLRNYTRDTRRKVYDDLLKIKEVLAM